MSLGVVAIIQARMGSTRLPGKVLLDIEGQPMLHRVMRRVGQAQRVQNSVIATTDQSRDDALVHYCNSQGWPVYRGSEDDVLDRYYQTAVAHQADIVVRITSDCPLIDPGVVDQLIEQFLSHLPHVDYMSNFEPKRTYPRGLDAEIMTFTALQKAWEEDKNPAWREHVTPYIYRNPKQFKIQGYVSQTDHSEERWTVDTQDDLAFVQKVYAAFDNDQFSWLDLLTLLQKHPEWALINQDIQQKKII